MKKIQDKDHQETSAKSGLFQKLFWNLAGPVFVVLAGLFLEYKTGLFQRVAQPENTPSISYASVLLLTATMFAVGLFAKDCIVIFLHQDKYFREQWALLLLFTASLLAIVGAMSIFVVLTMLQEVGEV